MSKPEKSTDATEDVQNDAPHETPGADHLRLVRYDDSPADVLPFERRTEDRRRLAGNVTGQVTYQVDGQTHQRICGLKLEDFCDAGMGVTSQEALPVGGDLTVFLPPCGAERGRDIRGKIVRCDAGKNTHHIGLELYHSWHARSA